ncbi:4'-phosphopantetheinyl transferase superfamily protein [Sphingomonas sp. PL-96]|uniref:4'-phosphopantetheinyl transferase family protein n=1 Tax=Sphingomonas sp. PL-96 TaxID=2887201 RepID=UPI001E3A953E|nr:4'-phosphopantetheinyl transferase superfamily protein [Sphingomonas sp. PL-96]MCC2975153.1 4'-phosphopantetheinyl transferase superfamily protein [Sphingomonas sp. PL-96]
MMAAAATVELVRVDLDAVLPEVLTALTTAGEREEAARRRNPADARRFLARRAAMRANLARLLRRPAREIALARDPLGRPQVPGSGIHVSQSSRGGVMIAAFSTDRPVGCDVEEVRGDVDVDAVAELCLGPAERRMLRTVPLPLRPRLFYDCWTRKEAFLKAIGTGMIVDMASFETTRRAGPATRWGRVDWASESWSPLAGFAAAVVARGTDWRLQHCPDVTMLGFGLAA